MARIFLSHSSKDKDFVHILATSLKKLGHTVWLDEWEVQVGDSIVTKVEGGIDHADFVAVVLSKNSTLSQWVEREWQAKYWDEVNKRKVMVLPILFEDCPIPSLLRPKKYADFRSDYEIGLVELARSLQPRSELSGISRYFSDFVDIVDDWLDLFKHSRRLDLVVMYSATWRNIFLKNIREMLTRPEGRLRVVLPETQIDHPLLQVYAERLSTTSKKLQDQIIGAIDDFSKLSEVGRVELYTTTRYFNHACSQLSG